MERREKVKIFRERFFGRQEVYGRKWVSKTEDGRVIKGYAPRCENFWKPPCHIRLKDGKTCATCEIKEYSPVTDESVWLHINADEDHIHYLVQDDGTCHFAVFDCDQKPGKEHLGHGWKDVKVLSAALTKYGIAHAIARSTGTEHLCGYHIYIFFSSPCQANKIRPVALHIFEECGFMEELRQGIRPIPEFFPKQDYAGGFGIGNGVKPPMQEKNWARGRNGFVTGEDEFIPPEEQWNYLANFPKVEVDLIDRIIAENNLEVDEYRGPSAGGGRRGTPGMPGLGPKRGKWQQPLTGSYEKVVEGCKALRMVYEKAANGEIPGHQEGFAAYHLAMSTADGLEYFRKNMTGWGQTEKDLRQLEHSLAKDYAPWTCRKMQEHGVCVPGTKCFDRKPPISLVEGQYVVMSDVPPDQWPEPSPIRYAFGKGEDFLDKLKADAEAIPKDEDENRKGMLLRDIAHRAQVFDEDQQRELKEHIKALKIIKWSEISKMFTKASDTHIKETKERASTRNDSVIVGDNCYKMVADPIGYEILRKQRSGHTYVRISDFIIEIEEEREFYDDEIVIRSMFCGKLKAHNYEIEFEIDREDWFDNSSFMKHFGRVAGSQFNLLRADLDYVRQAATGFSKKFGITKNNYLATQGWYHGTYLMPSVLIDKDSIRPNTERIVSLALKPHASFLDFKIIPEDELREIVFHIQNQFLNAWPRKWTMIALAHGLLPSIVTPLGIRKKPSLFFEGVTGSGKTELLHTLQYFWGHFDSIVNLASTGKGMMAVAHDFKDALLVFDDYKGIDHAQTVSLLRVIQYSYDPNVAVKLSKDSKIMPPKTSRGVIAFTGESFISNDSATVARTIMVETEKQDTILTQDIYNEVIERRESYCGVMPYFIHWILRQDGVMMKNRFKELVKHFYERVPAYRAMVNANRVAYNLGLNHFMWELWCKFLLHLGMVSPADADYLIKEHEGYAIEIQEHMMGRCTDEQNGEVFIRVLGQLVSSGEAIIEGLNDDATNARGQVVGFVEKATGTVPLTVNLFPDLVCRMVSNATRDHPIRGTEREFGRIFYEKGLLFAASEGRFKRQLRYKKGKPYVWSLDLAKLEWGDDVSYAANPDPVYKSKVLTIKQKKSGFDELD